MNKNELVRWLKAEKEAAVFAYRTTFEANRKNVEEQLYEACGANDVIKSLNELAAKENELIKAFNARNSGKMRMETYYSHNDAKAYMKTTDACYCSLKKIYEEQRDKILSNYENVIRQVKLLPLKDAVEWLTGIGFEIPDITVGTQKNEIVVQIDPTYLRLNKQPTPGEGVNQ